MVGHSTVGVDTTSSRARIDTTITDTALIARAIRVEYTLWSTRAVRIADVICRTDAIDGSVLLLALSVGTARIGIARTWWLNNVRFN